MTLNFKTTPEDAQLIEEIVYRVREYGIHDTLGVPSLTLQMDLTATHVNSRPLDLQALLESSQINFFYDIVGIHSHIDLDTGELRDKFTPRCGFRDDTANTQTDIHIRDSRETEVRDRAAQLFESSAVEPPPET